MAKYKHLKATQARTRKRLAAKPAIGNLDRWRTGLNEESIREKYPHEKGEEWKPNTPEPKIWNFKD